MDTVKITSYNTKMIAHRGLSGIERENTCPAFVAAGNRSYYGIETDVHVTADGKFVIIHDSTTARVSGNTVKINVEESSWEEIGKVVFPDKDGSFIRSDIRVPLLAEYVTICKKYGKKCVLELKGVFSEENLKKLVSEITELGYLDSVIFISFERENCIGIRELLPDNKVQFLTDSSVNSELIDFLIKNKLDLDIAHGRLDEDKVKLLHEKGIIVNCWTCDSKERAEELVRMGVDFITTNILE